MINFKKLFNFTKKNDHRSLDYKKPSSETLELERSSLPLEKDLTQDSGTLEKYFENRKRESEVREKESLVQKIEDDRFSKKSWSDFIMGYLSAFTLLLFFTIWIGYSIKLSPVTLNILISVGFTKVVAIAYIVVKHFYPLDEIKK